MFIFCGFIFRREWQPDLLGLIQIFPLPIKDLFQIIRILNYIERLVKIISIFLEFFTYVWKLCRRYWVRILGWNSSIFRSPGLNNFNGTELELGWCLCVLLFFVWPGFLFNLNILSFWDIRIYIQNSFNIIISRFPINCLIWIIWLY